VKLETDDHGNDRDLAQRVIYRRLLRLAQHLRLIVGLLYQRFLSD
jgi:hypothetical protein